MNYASLETGFFAALALGILILAALLAAPTWYLVVLLLIIFAGTWYGTRTLPDRAFYLACAGELLVIGCSTMNHWAGLYCACTLTGIIGSALGLVRTRDDLVLLFVFWLGSAFAALLIFLSNHVLLPLAAIMGITAGILAIHSVRLYQFRKYYSGA
ncbi:MAG: hypothetical protein GYA23_11835 [Methanomicrobiales archaeon]|nr:hypothetical protein [Methanomicrobiales archaeon]